MSERSSVTSYFSKLKAAPACCAEPKKRRARPCGGEPSSRSRSAEGHHVVFGYRTLSGRLGWPPHTTSTPPCRLPSAPLHGPRKARPDRHEGDQVKRRWQQPRRRLKRAVRRDLALLSPASRAELEFGDIGSSPTPATVGASLKGWCRATLGVCSTCYAGERQNTSAKS